VLKKDITYINFEDKPVTETWYFNLSTAELAKMTLTAGEDIVTRLQRVVASQDPKQMVEAFEDVVRRSVGTRSEDGKRFIKNTTITEEFMGGEAYSQFFLELATKEGLAVEFINGVIPKDLREQVAQLQAGTKPVEVIQTPLTPWTQPSAALTIEDFTSEELEVKPQDYLVSLYEGKLFSKPPLGRTLNVDELSDKELFALSKEDFDRLVGTDARKWPKRILIISMQRRANGK
jgi:hypothetical protein